MNEIINDDCFNVMKTLPDNFFDVTFTSPPTTELGMTLTNISMI